MTSITKTSTNPYVGPRPFQKGETLFGRDWETSQLRDLLIAERIVLLYAASGAGKTSLIQAALIPELEQENFEVLPIIRVCPMLPQALANPGSANRYVFNMLLSLDKRLPEDEEQCKKRLDELAGMKLTDYLDWRGSRLAGTNPEEMVTTDKHRSEILIFDQFEEILTEDPTDFEAKEEFFDQLGVVLGSAHRWALFALREENLAGLDPYRDFIPTLFSTTYRLELLTPAQAKLAVQCPAQEAGRNFTDGATDKLIDDLRKLRIQRPRGFVRELLGPYVEPLQLQIVCSYIWEKHGQNATEITKDDVKTGYVNSALTHFCEDALHAAAMIPEAMDRNINEGQLWEWCARYLITPAHTRAMVIEGQCTSEGIPNTVLEELVIRRLLRRHEEQSGVCWYELAHDRLIEPLQELSRPAELRSTQKTFTDEDLRQWLQKQADNISRSRRLRQHLQQRLNRSLNQFFEGLISTRAEQDYDWQSAGLDFGCKILNGSIDFANQTSWQLYALLEDLWLNDVKQFLAYLIWEAKGESWEPEQVQVNYYQACEDLRLGLADKPEIKGSRKGFGAVRLYLDHHYLSAGKLDFSKPSAQAMTERKAYRIMAATGQTDSLKNWLSAEQYARLFYNNIIPAVLEEDGEKTQMVLEALQLREAPESRFLIVNCFEAALAIYFLNPDIVKAQWDAGQLLRETTL
jgi:hypothetical protein